jgi:P-loop ATPase family protein
VTAAPEDPIAEDSGEQAVIILSGLSGGGKTAAAKLFEDLGYTVVDNLPGELLPELAELVSADERRFARVAIVLDVRAGDPVIALGAMRGALEGRGIQPRVVFLEARDDVLIRRFSETRHRHPLNDQRGIASSIAAERRILDPVRGEADVIVDTSDLSLRQLRERLFAQLATTTRPDQLAFQLISFGYKFGIPLESAAIGPDRGGPGLRPRPAGHGSLPRPDAPVPRLHDPGIHRGGQDPAHDRHRLHGGLPPQHRDRRGHRRLAARARRRPRRGLPSGARPDMSRRVAA